MSGTCSRIRVSVFELPSRTVAKKETRFHETRSLGPCSTRNQGFPFIFRGKWLKLKFSSGYESWFVDAMDNLMVHHLARDAGRQKVAPTRTICAVVKTRWKRCIITSWRRTNYIIIIHNNVYIKPCIENGLMTIPQGLGIMVYHPTF